MKIICKSPTQVPGFGIVDKGDIIDWPDGKKYPPQVVANFTDGNKVPLVQELENGEKAVVTQEENDRAAEIAQAELVRKFAAMGKQKLTAALDANGATYPAKATNEELAKLLLRSQGHNI